VIGSRVAAVAAFKLLIARTWQTALMPLHFQRSLRCQFVISYFPKIQILCVCPSASWMGSFKATTRCHNMQTPSSNCLAEKHDAALRKTLKTSAICHGGGGVFVQPLYEGAAW